MHRNIISIIGIFGAMLPQYAIVPQYVLASAETMRSTPESQFIFDDVIKTQTRAAPQIYNGDLVYQIPDEVKILKLDWLPKNQNIVIHSNGKVVISNKHKINRNVVVIARDVEVEGTIDTAGELYIEAARNLNIRGILKSQKGGCIFADQIEHNGKIDLEHYLELKARVLKTEKDSAITANAGATFDLNNWEHRGRLNLLGKGLNARIAQNLDNNGNIETTNNNLQLKQLKNQGTIHTYGNFFFDGTEFINLGNMLTTGAHEAHANLYRENGRFCSTDLFILKSDAIEFHNKARMWLNQAIIGSKYFTKFAPGVRTIISSSFPILKLETDGDLEYFGEHYHKASSEYALNEYFKETTLKRPHAMPKPDYKAWNQARININKGPYGLFMRAKRRIACDGIIRSGHGILSIQSEKTNIRGKIENISGVSGRDVEISSNEGQFNNVDINSCFNKTHVFSRKLAVSDSQFQGAETGINGDSLTFNGYNTGHRLFVSGKNVTNNGTIKGRDLASVHASEHYYDQRGSRILSDREAALIAPQNQGFQGRVEALKTTIQLKKMDLDQLLSQVKAREVDVHLDQDIIFERAQVFQHALRLWINKFTARDSIAAKGDFEVYAKRGIDVSAQYYTEHMPFLWSGPDPKNKYKQVAINVDGNLVLSSPEKIFASGLMAKAAGHIEIDGEKGVDASSCAVTNTEEYKYTTGWFLWEKEHTGHTDTVEFFRTALQAGGSINLRSKDGKIVAKGVRLTADGRIHASAITADFGALKAQAHYRHDVDGFFSSRSDSGYTTKYCALEGESNKAIELHAVDELYLEASGLTAPFVLLHAKQITIDPSTLKSEHHHHEDKFSILFKNGGVGFGFTELNSHQSITRQVAADIKADHIRFEGGRLDACVNIGGHTGEKTAVEFDVDHATFRGERNEGSVREDGSTFNVGFSSKGISGGFAEFDASESFTIYHPTFQNFSRVTNLRDGFVLEIRDGARFDAESSTGKPMKAFVHHTAGEQHEYSRSSFGFSFGGHGLSIHAKDADGSCRKEDNTTHLSIGAAENPIDRTDLFEPTYSTHHESGFSFSMPELSAFQKLFLARNLREFAGGFKEFARCAREMRTPTPVKQLVQRELKANWLNNLGGLNKTLKTMGIDTGFLGSTIELMQKVGQCVHHACLAADSDGLSKLGHMNEMMSSLGLDTSLFGDVANIVFYANHFVGAKPTTSAENIERINKNGLFTRLTYDLLKTGQMYAAQEKLSALFGRNWTELKAEDGSSGGFVGFDYGQKKFYISFRGSASKRDWSDPKVGNFNTKAAKHEYEGKEYVAHEGFDLGCAELSPQAIKFIRDLCTKMRLNPEEITFDVSGHSRGGALAALFIKDLKENFANSGIRLTNFSSPRSGDGEGFQDIYKGVDALHIYSEGDFVTKVPLGLQHPHGETVVEDCFGHEDPDDYIIPPQMIYAHHMKW